MPKRGAPTGNQNARKHGFYSQVLDEAAKLKFQQASEVEGLDAEIAIIRFKLGELLEKYPDRLDLQFKAASILARLISTRYNITAEQKKNLSDAILTVLKDVAVPLGLKFIQ